MLYVDLKYIGMVQSRLEKFSKKGDYTFNFRCPYCGDSQKNKWKARGYIFSVKGNLAYHCHNCGINRNMSQFITFLDPDLGKQYDLECFEERHGPKRKKEEQVKYTSAKPDFTKAEENLLDKLLDCLKNLPDDHEAIQFVKSRKIPEKSYSELYYIDDVSKLGELSQKYKDRIVGREPRLIIPFFDEKKRMFALTCRAFGDESLKYITIKIMEGYPLVYGVDRVDVSKQVNIVEGPIDSWFVDNCIAAGGSDMKKLRKILPKGSRIIPDNQPRNKDVVKYMRGSVNDGYDVVVWPSSIQEKDINEMIVDGGRTPEQLMKIIDDNTYSGLSATVAINEWSKC